MNEHEINSATYNTNSAQKVAVSIPSDTHANETEKRDDMESQSDFSKPVKHNLINRRIVFLVILIIAIYVPVGLFIIRQLQFALLYNDAPQKNTEAMNTSKTKLMSNFQYFGYGYLSSPGQLIPPVATTFYAFRIMIILGSFLLIFFLVVVILYRMKKIEKIKWLQWIGVFTIPLAYITSQSGWIVAEAGRQPWVIQDLMPTNASVSNLQTGSVQTTFFIFLVLFTILLIAELGIMFKAIKNGPEIVNNH